MKVYTFNHSFMNNRPMKAFIVASSMLLAAAQFSKIFKVPMGHAMKMIEK